MLLLGCAASAQTARVVLRWKAAPGVTRYQAQIARDTGFSQIVLDEKVPEPVLKWEALPSTTFYWRVRSFDAEGRASEWSAARQIAPATGPPAPKLPPEGTFLTCAAEPTALSLETSSVLKEYILELSADGRFAPGETTVLLSKTGEFQTVLPVGAISWRGRGVDLTGRTTEPSPPRRLTVRLAPPRPKVTPDVPAGTASVTLSWTGSACARRYVVEASHETPDRTAHEAQETSLSFRPAGIGEYRFRVAAQDDKGNPSEWSAESSFKVRLPAPIARTESIGAPGPAGVPVELGWSAPAQAASYLVELARTEGFKDPAASSVFTTTYRVTLSPGRYLWRVTARDPAGHLSFTSEPRAFVVAEDPELEKVSVLFPIEGAILLRPADGLLGIAWSKVDHATGHELELDGVVQAVGAPPTRVALPDGDHRVRVRAVGARGKSSPWSTPVRFYFGGPRVVSAQVAFGREPLRSDGVSTSRVEIRLLDAQGGVVPGARPELSVDHGSLSGLHDEGEAWVAQWQAPAELPPGQTGTLSVREGAYQGQHALRLAGDFSPFTLAGVVGGRFNGGAVASPAGALTLGYRPYLAGGRLTAHLRTAIYGGSATVQSPDGPVAARATVPAVTLLVGGHLQFGPWTLLGVIGGGVQVAASSVGVASQTTALPAFEIAAAFGRRLGPGAVEVELSFLYSRLNIPLARLQAGGLFLGIGYRFDLSGGK